MKKNNKFINSSNVPLLEQLSMKNSNLKIKTLTHTKENLVTNLRAKLNKTKIWMS